jgi:hypothetical protein
MQPIDRGTWPDTSPTRMNGLAATAGAAYARSAPLNYPITKSGQFALFDPVPLSR